jgi:hypothetical protein
MDHPSFDLAPHTVGIHPDGRAVRIVGLSGPVAGGMWR